MEPTPRAERRSRTAAAASVPRRRRMPGGVAFRAEGFYDRRVPLRVLIFGPGRVGVAFARRLRAAGCDVLGFVGRDAVRTRAAVDATGIGAPCDAGDHARAHVVVFAVGVGEDH